MPPIVTTSSVNFRKRTKQRYSSFQNSPFIDFCRQPFEQASKDIIPGHVWTQYPANCGHQYGHKYITLLRKPQSDKPRGVRGLAPDCITKINGKFWPGIKSFCGRVLSHYLAGQCVFTGRITVQTARVRNHRILSPQYYSYYS